MADKKKIRKSAHLGNEVWVVHAFKKKSTRGIKTPKREMDLVRDRLTRLKEMLK
jgi:phage-related protein